MLSFGRFTTFSLLAAVSLAGCTNSPSTPRSPGAKLLGKWQVTMSGEGMLAMGLPQPKIEEEYKEDGTVTTTIPSPLNMKMVGTWKFSKTEENVLVVLVKLPDSPEHERRLEFVDDDHFTALPPENATGASKTLKMHYVRIE